MRFRPCIDIHNGAVKQIVGGSLKDEADFATNNFVSELKADFYADLYRRSGLEGGHIILLNPVGSAYYKEDLEQAKLALAAYPEGLQIGGGITAENAEQFLDMGARQVIVTSYVFKDGRINYENLTRLSSLVGAEHLVLDLSCRKKDGGYYIVTDRWQKFTEEQVVPETLDRLSEYCCEYLIHAVDVEGKAAGIETELAQMLGTWGRQPMTYAGGVGNFADLENLKHCGRDRIDVTVGSALDIFGGKLPYEEVVKFCS
ncbi:phosphoribosylformimino-5-aminoimidazole carboxamide ribotide isomerase [Eubacterium sp. MSJ-33]|uniref:phosphoribosylformimino-5-aminoimidazole carboxamide ribotide isomerase n=1 Tax=Eubacterium sp. MSJ-33 TaxID=2841528 RepID=UPI001C765BC6|nr:phosphoribosylformimino-5-aminoimidazole carboxamide ribotide isomerase [Eubacterium sp. MSJ-33]QWT52371.1 phosphoribosylformimino-5-aminoimidazole carboxamide ribotide isomerase [Eubacterium sp. MSJ-33]